MYSTATGYLASWVKKNSLKQQPTKSHPRAELGISKPYRRVTLLSTSWNVQNVCHVAMSFPPFPAILFASSWGEELVEELEKFRSLFQTKKDKVSLVDRYTDGSGRQRIKGNKNLKMSQSYPLPPPGFPWSVLNSIVDSKMEAPHLSGISNRFVWLNFNWMSPKGWSLGNPNGLSWLRFGIALARLRSHHAARIKAQAVKTIKQNVKTYRTVPRSTRKDAMWVKHAELQSIFDFIA